MHYIEQMRFVVALCHRRGQTRLALHDSRARPVRQNSYRICRAIIFPFSLYGRVRKSSELPNPASASVQDRVHMLAVTLGAGNAE
jgi:hypothetical protein